MPPKISFLAFFIQYAERMRWVIPDIHIVMCHWLEHRGLVAVLRVFRGAGKSTLLEIYNAWRYYCDPTLRILHQSESDKTAYKTSRGTQNVLRMHPLTQGLFRDGAIETWWVEGAIDPRNGSMHAKGITSNVTSARADECQNDDVEVPKNILNPEAREKMRFRLDEQTHIMVPGASQLYIGTPHTHDSIYDEQEKMGADCLTIKMYEKEFRIEDASTRVFAVPFKPEHVFSGIHKMTRLLVDGVDYRYDQGEIIFARNVTGLVDLYAGSAWPERFTGEEMLSRRKKIRTINQWDSQYQLHSKPIHQIKLPPEQLQPYDVEPEIRYANRTYTMWLGMAEIVSASARWDPASGKLNSDVSSFSILFQDEAGNMYWHIARALSGKVAEFEGDKVTGGQVWQIAELVKRFQLSNVNVETNGIGTHCPALLRAAFSAFNLQCGITELNTSKNKNLRIMANIEPALTSGYLWAHVDVIQEVEEVMKDWNPAVTKQPDDHLDSLAGAMENEPVRIGKLNGNAEAKEPDNWRKRAKTTEVIFES